MIIKKQYVNGYIETIRGTFVKKKQANEFKLVQSIQDGLMIINHLSFVNHFEDYVLSDGSEYIVSEASQELKLDDNGLPMYDDDNNPIMIDVPEITDVRPSFDDIVSVDVNGTLIDVQFASGIATMDVSSYTNYTQISTNLDSTDNILIILNDIAEQLSKLEELQVTTKDQFNTAVLAYGLESDQAKSAYDLWQGSLKCCDSQSIYELNSRIVELESDAEMYLLALMSVESGV